MLSLKNYGIEFEGAIERVNKIPLEAIPLLKLQMGHDGYYYKCMEYKLKGGVKADEGNYGHVDEWTDMNTGEILYEKRCHGGGTCLLMEAAMQHLVRKVLAEIECERMVADVKLICRRDDGEITFMMEAFDKHRVIALHDACLSAYSSAYSSGEAESFDRWFVETLGQLILICGYLENAIKVNHRDLKGDNILVNTTPCQSVIVIPLGEYKWRLQYHNEIKIVDFGLACKGTAKDMAGTLSVGEVFARGEVCPKEGRDLYFLLCYFYGMSGFRSACSRRLLEMIESWIGPGKVLDALRVDGIKKLPWINFLINTTSYSCKSACAEILLRDLAVEYPDILRAYK